MAKPTSTPSITKLTRENVRLKSINAHLANRITELELRLGGVAPVFTEHFKDHAVHLIVWMDAPMVLADDVIPMIPDAPAPYLKKSKGRLTPQAAERLRRLGLGSREIATIERAHLRDAWSLIERSICRALGVSTTTHYISFVTALGIETLRDRAPEFCAWIEREAFPKVIERFGKGGAA